MGWIKRCLNAPNVYVHVLNCIFPGGKREHDASRNWQKGTAWQSKAAKLDAPYGAVAAAGVEETSYPVPLQHLQVLHASCSSHFRAPL